jgi:hypothetical protein
MTQTPLIGSSQFATHIYKKPVSSTALSAKDADGSSCHCDNKMTGNTVMISALKKISKLKIGKNVISNRYKAEVFASVVFSMS